MRSAIERRSNKYAYKGSVKQIEANRLSKTAGYGLEVMRWSIKSDEFAKKAAKARLAIANNERYIAKVTQKVNSISDKEGRRR